MLKIHKSKLQEIIYKMQNIHQHLKMSIDAASQKTGTAHFDENYIIKNNSDIVDILKSSEHI